MKDISIKNVSTATVVITLPDLHFRRELTPGRSATIPEEIYNELRFDPGTAGLLDDHYLVISGIDDEGVKITTDAVDSTEISRMFDEQDITAFAKFIPNAAQAERDTVIRLAIDKGVTAPAFVSLIKKYCGTDIIQAINFKHLAEE